MKTKVLSLIFSFSFLTAFAQQDLEIIYLSTWTYPQTGCDIGGPNDMIQLALKNNSVMQTAFGIQIYFCYQIDNGPIVRDSIPTLFGGATWQCNFLNNTVDLSACKDTFHIVTWVEYINDPDNSNDTLAYDFVNFCSINPGVLYNDSTHHDLTALDTLEISGAQHQTSIQWQFSWDTTNWMNLVGWNLTMPYSYVDTLRYYRAILSNPECAPDTTNSVEIRYLDSTLSVTELVENNLINIYPNPASKTLKIYSKKESKATLINSKGQTLKEIQLIKGLNLTDVSSLEQGCYYLRIINEGNYRTIPFVKLE